MNRSPRRAVTVALLAVVAIFTAFARADDNALVLAAYNAENLFDVFDDPYTEDQDTQVKPRTEVEAIARVLRQLDADVIAFSEIENRGVLEALVAEMLGDMGYRYIAVNTTNSGRGINLGVVSRLPIDAVTSYRHRELTLPGEETTWRFARDLMHVRVSLPHGEPMEIFAVHFKSKRDSAGDPDSAKWRLAEATEAASIITNVMQQHPDRWVAMLGDFNDTPGSPPIDTLLDAGLIDAHAALPSARRVTYLRQPYRSTIDYLLVNPPMRQAMVSATVPTNPALLEGSDHAPVIATFRLPQ